MPPAPASKFSLLLTWFQPRRASRGASWLGLSLTFCLLALLLSACGRSPTEREQMFLGKIHGESLDYSRLRLVEGAPLRAVTFRRPQRPRVTCRERILPPRPAGELVTASPAALALFNHIFFTRDWFLPDYTPEYPEALHLVEAMLLAHEATHVWQWQNRAVTGYTPLKALGEHSRSSDPYLFDLDGPADFLAYGYEQQGTIVEEYVCCRALAPDAARTQRLHAMLARVMPVSDLPQSRESDVYLPWKDAKVAGICD
ncbi:hypothetical protein [Tritonibacter mobilis]|uniref:hypothetical protein n=1 Tax=Tritonibacter mobilis TaxID=379347 RepID=UPI003A5C3C5A